MFELLKTILKKNNSDGSEYNSQASMLMEEIRILEDKFEKNKRDGEAQKELMITYNRALKVYAKSTKFRNQIDPLFLKIDDLRNTIRKNI